MKKQIIGMAALGLMMAAPALADENVTSKFKLSLGGFVKLDYANNSEKIGPLAPASGAIPKTTVANSAGTQSESVFTARQSRLWLKSSGPDLFGGKTGAMIEGDFYGDLSGATEAPQLRMRLAYATVDWTNTQVLFGQYWDTFGPMAASTVDFRQNASFGAPNSPRVPQLRATQKYNLGESNSITTVLALQDPTQGEVGAAAATPGANYEWTNMVNAAGQVMFSSKALGVAPGFYGMSNKPFTVGLFGLYGSGKIAATPTTGTATTVNLTLPSWGYGAYAFLPILKSSDGKSRANTASLEAQIAMASNMPFNNGTANQLMAGGKAGAKGYNFDVELKAYATQDLGMTFGYGRRGVLNAGFYSATDNAAGNQQFGYNIYGNVSYDLNAAVRVATEYEYLRTGYIDNSFGQSHTLRAAVYYFF